MSTKDDSQDYVEEKSALKRAVKALWMVMKPTLKPDTDGRSTDSLI
jgi:hypothetical protein